jgi:hypothetical protein
MTKTDTMAKINRTKRVHGIFFFIFVVLLFPSLWDVKVRFACFGENLLAAVGQTPKANEMRGGKVLPFKLILSLF